TEVMSLRLCKKSCRIWPVDFGPVRPHRMVGPGDLLRRVPSDTDFGAGITPTMLSGAFCTQNAYHFTPYFSGISECPDLV
ncbi:MAG: hypothetical protein LUQ59_02375, partial [Methanothrix sp.]|nr:hypothetical protein [Methanothrix sp.]